MGPRILMEKLYETFAGAEQHLWYLAMPGGALVAVSHVSFAADTMEPECMAFPAELVAGEYTISSFENLAVSYSPDPEEGLREVVAKLMEMHEEGEI